jgi:hypothetical protein
MTAIFNSTRHQPNPKPTKNRTMKKESRTQQNKESLSNKQPVDPRADPFARDSRGAASREEIPAKTPVVSAPRQSNLGTERSNQKRGNGRGSAVGKQIKLKGEK